MVIKIIPATSGKCQNGSGACLTEEDFDFWYEAVPKDDVDSVKTYLKSVGGTRTAELLNGHICDGNSEKFDKIKGLTLNIVKSLEYAQPMHIASYLGAEKLIELCLENGVNAFQQDKNGDNLVHALIRANAQLPALEKRYLSVLRLYKAQFTTDEIRWLLHHENDNGYRPLELAAHFGMFGMFTEIFMTNEIYRKRKRNIGMLSLRYYDITEYESYEVETNRRMKSPLWFLGHLDTKLLNKESTKEFFASNPVKVWCELKIKANWPLMFLWFLMRFSIAALTIYWDLSGGSLTEQNRNDINNVISGNLSTNETDCIIETYVASQSFLSSQSVLLMLQYIMFASASSIVLFDILEVAMWLKFGWFKQFFTTNGGEIKSVVSNASEFRVTQLVSSLSCITMVISLMLGLKTMFNISYLIHTVLMTWGLVYFSQILPWLGVTVISIQRLFIQLLSYVVIIGLFIVPMSVIIMSLLTKNHVGPCPPEIDLTDFPQTVYLGFTILLNMFNLTGYPLHEYISIYAYHVIYVFLISILMLNFIIASFSTTIATLQENQQAVTIVQRLSIAMQVEYRVGAVFPCLVHTLHKWAFQYCPDEKAFYVNRLIGRHAP